MPTISLTPYPLSYPASTVRFLAEAWWTCYSSPPYTWRQRSDAILATGQPLSVILPGTRDDLDLEITPAPGWKGFGPTWLGVPCHVGRVTLSLPIYGAPGQFHSFSLLTLFPQQDVPDAPPYIQLGVQFLLENHIEVVLNESATGDNRLVLP